jgi:Bacterial extracellular solute-binding proteins, family 5 Middle.
MPTNLEGKYINAEDQKLGVNLGITDEAQRINQVKSMLAEAGYSSKFTDGGELIGTYNAKGEKIPTLFITSPAGWTDWESIVTIAVEGMRKAGIDIREGFVDGGQYWPAMGTGNFDLIMHKPTADVSRLSRGAASTKLWPAATGSRSALGPVPISAVTTSRALRSSVPKWTASWASFRS